MLKAQSEAAPNPSSPTFESLTQSAKAAHDAGKADEAIRDYSSALGLKPDWAEGWWDLGMAQYEANRYDDAVNSFGNLTRLAPSAAIGWSMLGLSQFETKDYTGSMTSLEKAQTLGGIDDPQITHVSAYHLALLLIRSAQFDRATALLKSAFGRSASPQVKSALGLALLRVPLLPSDVDPSQDALVHAVGDAAASADPNALAALIQQNPRAPWLHYAYGVALATAGNAQEALTQQKLESAISPTSALPWIEMSGLELRLKEVPQALSAAQRATSLEPQSSAAHKALAQVFASEGKTQEAATEQQEAERLSNAPPQRDPQTISRYHVHTAAAPQNSAIWTTAMQDYSAGRYAQAIDELKGWLEHNPDDGTAWAVMGLSEFALKDYDNARIHIQRGINLGLKVSPEAEQLAHYRLALLLIREGQFDTATALLKPEAGHPPMGDQIQLALGLALLHSPKMPEELDGQYRNLAQSSGAIVELLFASRYAEAFPAFVELIAEYPTTPWLHYAYGNALDSFSRYDDAKAEMQAELKLSPQNALPWIRLASIDLRQHQPEAAVKAAQNALALDRNSAEAHYQLGRAWLENGDVQKSITELNRADELRPKAPEIHFALARAYAKANLPDKAAVERTTFTQLKAAANQKSDGAQGESILQTNAQ
ncbi:MAG TPA: tetratricopeptide repeat protein [Silvibacterium sp.]|nr:tetratricopeptide repeat protein [Silvibacterium sp.]